MGKYLTDEQIRRAREELSLFYSLPYAIDLVGTAWEDILADLKGGQSTGLRDNRARPDLRVRVENREIRYSVKTERLRLTPTRQSAAHFLGTEEDLIVARPKVDELLGPRANIAKIKPNKLGAKVLEYYNEQIVKKFGWDVLSILFRVGDQEFIYWEEQPVPLYDPPDYWWRDSGRATGTNRNINGYPNSVPKKTRPEKLPRAKFKWTSGGKQFYVLYEIPRDADIWAIERVELDAEEIRAALVDKLRAKKRTAGQPPST